MAAMQGFLCFDSQLPACYLNIPITLHIPSYGMHESPQSSIKLVAPLRALDYCCKPMLGHLYGAYTHYGNNYKGSTI